jgi:hypothetical protein
MKAYRIIAHAISGCVVLQATWIALSGFIIVHASDDGTTIDTENFGAKLHSIFGMGVIPLLAIALLILSLVAGIPGGTQWAAYLLGAVVVQIGLAYASASIPAIGILHGLTAFAIIALAEIGARRASASAEPAVSPTPA